MVNTPNILSLSDAAAERVKHLLSKRDDPSAVLRIGVKTQGCSGLSYTIEYADEKDAGDEVVEDKGATIYVDRQAVMYIAGSEIDYVEGTFESGFVFSNPNEKGRCGCGISFRV